MIIYILFLVYLFFTTMLYTQSKRKHKQKIIFLIANFIPLVLISGFRDCTVGIDTKQFTGAFSKIINMSPKYFNTLRYEYGFSYLCWILGKISSNPQILIFVTSFFINISIARFIYKNSDNVCLSTILYILCNFFFSYMNIMRQAIAIAIILWGYEYLKGKKYIKFSIFVLFASFFHTSAFLALILIIFNNFEFDKKFLNITFIATILCFLFGKKFFLVLANMSPRLYEYVGGNYDVENYFAALLEFMVYLVSFIFGIIVIDRKENNNKNNILIGIIGIVVVLSSLVMRVSIFNRFTHYFSIFLIIWMANVINEIKNGKKRLFVQGGIVALFMLYWLIIMIYRPEWYGAVPYKFIF